MHVPEALSTLATAWRSAVERPRRRALVLAGTLLLTVALLVARMGTTPARLAALGIVLAYLVAVVLVLLRERAIFRDPVRTIERVAGDASPELAARAVRALSLLAGGAQPGISRELAELHVERAVARLPHDSVLRSAARLGTVLTVLAAGLACANLAACVSNPWGVVEGADVLLARDGTAPLGMAWLSDTQMRARPPEYLHLEERRLLAYDDTTLPRGTLLTITGVPVHGGRRLLLTDGTSEVPFVDDGSGKVVARWPLAESVRLRVIARFGEVVIPESEDTQVESVADAAPVVTLEGAPRRIVLAADQATSEIPIHYDVTDDHGLREVHLVLRAGAREERRVLARLDGETKTDRGGYNLRATDSFVKKSHAPIEVRVEAKDNDPITGPKWGASDAITLVPPDVGEPEARRLAALVKVRDALVDALAIRLSRAMPTDPKVRRELLDADAKLADENADLMETTLTSSYAGVRIPSRLGAMLRGRMRKLKEAVGNQGRSPSTASRAAVVKATERMVLVVDAVVRGQGLRDTRDVAKELADVADDLALSAQIAQKPQEKARGEQRMDASVMVLGGGGRAMLRLGALGRDLGEIVEMDLRRVDRARKDADLPHTALAAQDLAARLRQPDPSFGARGGRPSHAGGESGGGRGAQSGEDAEGSDVEQAFNEAAQDLDRLSAEHNANMGGVEQALAGGSSEDDRKQMAEEAKRHAERVREAAKGLPSVGGGSDSWTSKGAAAREHAEQMARSLEQGSPADAVQSGRSAMGALDEARRAAARERFSRFGDTEGPRAVEEAKKTLDQELRWAEDKLEEMRKRAAQRAGPELKEHGETEGKLAEKARDLAKKGRDQEALPPAALEALQGAEQAAREASRALKEGNADRGLQQQREAQQKLEMARDALGERGEEGKDGEGERGPSSREHTEIPKADAHKGPEEFRKRVIKGLGQPSGGRYKDAVKRYAEGLLR